MRIIKFEKTINLILLALFLLIPLALITGAFLSDLFLSLSAVLLIILLVKKKQLVFFKEKFFFYFLLLYFLFIFSSLISSNAKFSIETSVFYIRFIVFIFVTIYLIKNNKNFFNYLLYIMMLIYSVLFLDTLFQFINGKNIIGLYYLNESNFRNTSFFGNRGVLGSYTIRLLPLLLSLISIKFYKNLFYKKYIIILFLFLSGSIILLSGERTALFLFSIFIFLTFIFIRDLRVPIFLSCLIFLLFSILALSSSEKLYGRIIKQPIDQMFVKNNAVDQPNETSKKKFVIFSSIYESHYMIAIKMFKEKPIFGHGPKMFRDYCSRPENYLAEGACTTHPHNVLLQLLSETGLVATFIVYFYFFLIIYKLVRNLFVKSEEKTDQSTIFLMILLIINLFPFSPSGNFFNNWLNVIYYYPLGILFYLSYEKKIKR
jgi:O-antigen ligase